MYIRDAKQCFGVHLKMHLKTLLFVISVMSQLDKAWSLQVSSYKSIECMQPCNLSGSPLSCTVHTVTLPAGKVQCYRLCGEVHSLGRSTPCDVFLVNTTIDGTTWCYVCDYDDSGEYLLSQLDGVQAFVMQELTNKGKYSMLKWFSRIMKLSTFSLHTFRVRSLGPCGRLMKISGVLTQLNSFSDIVTDQIINGRPLKIRTQP